jgi:hypothetical protein
MDRAHDDGEDAAPGQHQQGQSGYAGGGSHPTDLIRAGMVVVSAEGEVVGIVAGIEQDEIKLEPGTDGEPGEVPLTLVDAVEPGRVVLRSRGDNAFGMEA